LFIRSLPLTASTHAALLSFYYAVAFVSFFGAPAVEASFLPSFFFPLSFLPSFFPPSLPDSFLLSAAGSLWPSAFLSSFAAVSAAGAAVVPAVAVVASLPF